VALQLIFNPNKVTTIGKSMGIDEVVASLSSMHVGDQRVGGGAYQVQV